MFELGIFIPTFVVKLRQGPVVLFSSVESSSLPRTLFTYIKTKFVN